MSPSKVKPSAPEQRKRASSQDGLDTLKKDLTKVDICVAGEDLSSWVRSLM